MIKTSLIFQSEYRLDLKYQTSVLIPYLFNNFDTNLIISISANPSKNYRSAGRIEQLIYTYPRNLIVASHIVRLGEQELEFPQRGDYRLQFIPNYYLGKTNLIIKKMFFSSSSKQQTTIAQPATEISVNSTQKSTILTEKSDNSRHSFLIVNAGNSTVYFKYVPIGTDPTATTVTISSTNYDLSLAGGEKFIDSNSSQNALVGICSGLLATTKLKITEYIYS